MSQQPQPSSASPLMSAPTSSPVPLPSSSSSIHRSPSSSQQHSLRDRSTLQKHERDKDSVDESTALSSATVAAASSSNAQRKEKFLDQFLASVASFPPFLQQKMQLMRELDEQCNTKMQQLQQFSKQHIHAIQMKWTPQSTQANNNTDTTNTSSSSSSSSSSFSSSSSTSSAVAPSVYDIDAAELRLRALSDDLHRCAKQKITLAAECYDVMDTHVRRLDASLKKYEAKLRKGNFEVSATPIDRRRGTKRAFDAEARDIYYILLADLKHDIDKSSSSHAFNNTAAASSAAAGAGSAAGTAGVAYANTGVDPNEPVYCFCRKPSHGAMVACDNEECEIEWFHFLCVGLLSKPRGKWYCPDCKKKKRKVT